MLNLKADRFVRVMSFVATMDAGLSLLKNALKVNKTGSKGPYTFFMSKDFQDEIEAVHQELIAMDLWMSCKALIRVKEKAIGPADFDGLGTAIRDFRTRIFEELERQRFLVLSTKENTYFQPTDPLLGREVDVKFPSAKYDTDQAGKALALGLSTAAVFHSMRILEIGILSLAKCLSIPDPMNPAERNWGRILGSIRAGMTAKWPTAASRHGGDGALFEALSASLDAVKNPWRNATMHVENVYFEAEAEHILIAVRGFMARLAARMDENGLPLA